MSENMSQSEVDDLNERLQAKRSEETPAEVNTPANHVIVVPYGTTVGELEQTYIFLVLEKNEGNKTKTAKELGVTVKTLYNKLHAYGYFGEPKTEGVNNASN